MVASVIPATGTVSVAVTVPVVAATFAPAAFDTVNV
jgi:hypothetical protein